MAIELGTETITVVSQERTYRVNIETALGSDPIVTAFREQVKTANDQTLMKHDTVMVRRALSAVVTETQPFTPATVGVITALELAGLIASRVDMWRSQDSATSLTPS